MLYQILQLDFPVAEVEVTEKGHFISLHALCDEARLPVWGYEGEESLLAMLNHWWIQRSIPETRKNLPDFLAAADVETAAALAVKCHGVSLSDQYWIKPLHSSLQWKDINLFSHDFAPLSVSSLRSEEERIATADSSLNGELVKFWTIEGGQRKLYKESTKVYYQQAYNEVFAARLLERLGIPHVPYELVMKGEIPYLACPLFTSEEREYVPARAILTARKKQNHESDYMHFLKCVEQLAIPVRKQEIDTMLAFDFLINNSDRHYGNFGFLRNPKTLQFIGMAPLFDHGNSMWNFDANFDIRLREQPSKPFKVVHEKQIRLADEAQLSLERVSDEWLRQEIEEIYSQNPRMDSARIELLQDRVCALKHKLEGLRIGTPHS